MNKLTEKGAVDFIFIAVLVILIAAAGFTVWRIQQADETVNNTAANTQNNYMESSQNNAVDSNPQDKTEQAEEATVAKDEIPEGFELFEGENLGFAYPSNWNVTKFDSRDNLLEGYEVRYTDPSKPSDAPYCSGSLGYGNDLLVEIFFTNPARTYEEAQKAIDSLRGELQVSESEIDGFSAQRYFQDSSEQIDNNGTVGCGGSLDTYAITENGGILVAYHQNESSPEHDNALKIVESLNLY